MTCISLILKLKKWIDNVCLLFLSGILRTTSLFQFQFSTQKFFRESWQCFQQSLANSSSWSATTLWERYSSKFDNYWDCLSLISAPKVMDLLALGNSAANFLLYCIMSTQVSLHLRSILSCFSPVPKDDQEDAGDWEEKPNLHQCHSHHKTWGKTLPEAQRTHGIETVTGVTKFGHQMVPLALVWNLPTRWHQMYWHTYYLIVSKS